MRLAGFRQGQEVYHATQFSSPSIRFLILLTATKKLIHVPIVTTLRARQLLNPERSACKMVQPYNP
jgi:hypothetical protein